MLDRTSNRLTALAGAVALSTTTLVGPAAAAISALPSRAQAAPASAAFDNALDAVALNDVVIYSSDALTDTVDTAALPDAFIYSTVPYAPLAGAVDGAALPDSFDY